MESILKQSFQDFEIIFVDNGSNDGSIKFVEDNFKSPRVKMYKLDKNLGFAGGNNFGYKYCTGEYVVLLNNDTVVERDWLFNLLGCIKEHENIGVAQSLVITEGIPERFYLMNGTINLLGHNIMEVFEIGKDGYGEIFQANGCSLIIRKSLADSLNGLFPDEYFAYSEDTFLCFKVKFRGLKIMHTSNSVVFHKGGGTASRENVSALYFYQERNRLLNFILFFSNKFFLKYIFFLIINYFIKLTASVFSKRYSAIALTKAYLWMIFNQKWIRQKRKSLNMLKTVDEETVLQYLSGKIFNGNNFCEKLVNSCSAGYCKLTGLQVFENKSADK